MKNSTINSIVLLIILTPTTVFSKECVWEHRTGYANGGAFESRLGYSVTGNKLDPNLMLASKDSNKIGVFKYQCGMWVTQNADITVTYPDDTVINDLDLVEFDGFLGHKNLYLVAAVIFFFSFAVA